MSSSVCSTFSALPVFESCIWRMRSHVSFIVCSLSFRHEMYRDSSCFFSARFASRAQCCFHNKYGSSNRELICFFDRQAAGLLRFLCFFFETFGLWIATILLGVVGGVNAELSLTLQLSLT